ncbi:MAG: VOC family protein [Desulfarculus sp.]|nr:VOC family protein [Desulfarculus sp.]
MSQALAYAFDHIGVVVPSVDWGRPRLAPLWGVSRWTQVFNDPIHKVIVQFGQDTSGIVYELVAPLGDDAPIKQALDKGHNLLNHLAYRTPDLQVAAAVLRRQGCIPLGRPAPAVAFGGQPVQFFLTPVRIILEVVQGAALVHKFELNPDGGALAIG